MEEGELLGIDTPPEEGVVGKRGEWGGVKDGGEEKEGGENLTHTLVFTSGSNPSS